MTPARRAGPGRGRGGGGEKEGGVLEHLKDARAAEERWHEARRASRAAATQDPASWLREAGTRPQSNGEPREGWTEDRSLTM